MRLTEEDRKELNRLIGYMQAIEMIVGEKLSADCKNALAKGIHYYSCSLAKAIENAFVDRKEDE